MIEISLTKGYGYIKIKIYHNNKNIDFDSIGDEYLKDIRELQDKEKSVIKKIKG